MYTNNTLKPLQTPEGFITVHPVYYTALILIRFHFFTNSSGSREADAPHNKGNNEWNGSVLFSKEEQLNSMGKLSEWRFLVIITMQVIRGTNLPSSQGLSSMAYNSAIKLQL